MPGLYPDDLIGWCDHPFVSLRDWRCPYCGCELNETARQRLLAAETLAPEGCLWALQSRTLDGYGDDEGDSFDSVSLHRDRNKIARQAVRDRMYDAASLRKKLARMEWHQGVFNDCLFQGYEDEYDGEEEVRFPSQYHLSLNCIDGF